MERHIMSADLVVFHISGSEHDGFIFFFVMIPRGTGEEHTVLEEESGSLGKKRGLLSCCSC